MIATTLRSALLATVLALFATSTAGAAPHTATRIDETIDLTGTTFAGAGCTGGDLTYTAGSEHITAVLRGSRAQLWADYGFTAVDTLTGETFRGAGSRHQLVRGSDSLFHINLRLAGDRGSRIMLTGTLHLDAGGQSGHLVHALECIHSGG
jgi:hypothetical protein